MRETGMNWDDARLFLAVARAGQMLAASRRVGATQATVSRRVAALEETLGVKLLVRRTHGSELTEEGRALAEALERVEAEMTAAQARLSGGAEAVSGIVRLGAPDGFGLAFLAPRLGRLAERHPELTIQLAPTPRGFSLAQREADVAVMIGRPEKGRLIARKLTDYTLGLYAAPSYLATRPPPASVEDLRAHRLIGYVEDLIHAPELAYAPEIWRPWRSQLEISSAVGQLEAARAGAGIAVLHDYLVQDAPDLTPVLPEIRVTRAYWIAYHESLKDAARLRAVVDFLTELVRDAQGRFARPA